MVQVVEIEYISMFPKTNSAHKGQPLYKNDRQIWIVPCIFNPGQLPSSL